MLPWNKAWFIVGSFQKYYKLNKIWRWIWKNVQSNPFGGKNYYNFIKDIIDEQFQTYDENHERSFLDLYFKQIKSAQKANEPTSFYYKQLILICADFLNPVLTGLPISITFCIQRLILQPDIQTKIQEELDEIVGHGRLPTLDDRINLHYTEAFIREILRMETLIPSNVAHSALENTTLAGYDVPKVCIVITSLESVNLDENIWKDVSSCKPERFLDENGKFSSKKDRSLPFGAGKRLCAGETFARNLMFLMISAVLQNFTIKEPNGMKVPDPREKLTVLISFTPPFWARFESRNYY